jgi:hypothetical protein
MSEWLTAADKTNKILCEILVELKSIKLILQVDGGHTRNLIKNVYESVDSLADNIESFAERIEELE